MFLEVGGESVLKTDKIEQQKGHAQIICTQLKAGEYNKDFLDLVKKFDPYFKRLARYKAYDGVDYEGMVSSFWLELMNGNAICSYEGMNGASLKSYLTNIFLWRIYTANKKYASARKCEVAVKPHMLTVIAESPERSGARRIQEHNHLDGPYKDLQASGSDSYSSNVVDFMNQPRDPATETEEKQRMEFLLRALNELSRIRPQAARLIALRLAGMSFKEIAQRFLEDEYDIANRSKEEKEKRIKTESTRLRKQFTRKDTGSIARLQIILRRLMEK